MEIGGKITTNKKNYGKYIHQGKTSEIKFGKKQTNPQTKTVQSPYEEITGLNDLDPGLMTKNFENNIKKEPLKIEMQLERAEKKLEKVKEEIKMNEVLGISSPEQDEKLHKTRERLEKDIQKHRQKYRQQGLTYQIADTVNQAEKTIKETTETAVEFGSRFIPGAENRQKVKYAKMLDKKLSNELQRPGASRPRHIEPLLYQAERLNRLNS